MNKQVHCTDSRNMLTRFQKFGLLLVFNLRFCHFQKFLLKLFAEKLQTLQQTQLLINVSNLPALLLGEDRKKKNLEVFGSSYFLPVLSLLFLGF